MTDPILTDIADLIPTDTDTQADLIPDDESADTEPILTLFPLDEITSLRDALQDQLATLTDFQAQIGELRAMLKAPAPPPSAIGNPAQAPTLDAESVREMDVNSIKRRLDEVLGALKRG